MDPNASDGTNTASVDAVAVRVLETLLLSVTALQSVLQTPTGSDPVMEASNTTSLPLFSSSNSGAGPCEYFCAMYIFIDIHTGSSVSMGSYYTLASGGISVYSPASPEQSQPVGPDTQQRLRGEHTARDHERGVGHCRASQTSGSLAQANWLASLTMPWRSVANQRDSNWQPIRSLVKPLLPTIMPLIAVVMTFKLC